MNVESQDGGDRFMRLFQYISGANSDDKKISMTTPVFMESDADESPGEMAFVIPKQIANGAIPAPSSKHIRIRKRVGGQFAVFRFSGRMDGESTKRAEVELSKWMEDQKLVAAGQPEFASYDPPWTPGPLRRNELLIRLKQSVAAQ